MFEIVFTTATHFFVFILGIAFDRFILKHIIADGKRIEFKMGEIMRVTVLLIIFMIYSVSLIQSQFFAGTAPTVPLTLLGIFSFGSLVGERDFFVKVLSNFIRK